MKHLLYISRLNQPQSGPLVPRGLLDIFHSAKAKNRRYGISGILAYKCGHYLQVIEGPNKHVDNLFTNILKDSRHKDVAVLVDQDCQQRSFANWRFESRLDLLSNSDFSDFIDRYNTQLHKGGKEKLDLLSVFLTLKPQQPRYTAVPENFCHTHLKLVHWPNLHHLGQTAASINLCANLLHKAWSYEELVASQTSFTRVELDRYLIEFKRQLALEVVADVCDSEKVDLLAATDTFYQRMRNFLSMH